MLRSGHGGRNGSKSARSVGKIRVADKRSNFLNLVRDIAGGDLLFCLDPSSIEGVAVGGTVTDWYDSWEVFSTRFTSADKPVLEVYNGKPAVTFNGTSNYMNTAATVAQLNSGRALSLLYFVKCAGENAASSGQAIFDLGAFWYNISGFSTSINPNEEPAVYNAQADTNSSQLNLGGIAGANGVNVDVTKPVVIGVTYDRNAPGTGIGAATKPYLQGAPVATGDIYTDGGELFNINNAWESDQVIHMGRRHGGSTLHFKGSLGCIVAITRVLTEGEMNRLSSAILDKQNVGNDAPAIQEKQMSEQRLPITYYIVTEANSGGNGTAIKKGLSKYRVLADWGHTTPSNAINSIQTEWPIFNINQWIIDSGYTIPVTPIVP